MLRKNIPNLLTLGNLIVGCVGLLSIFENKGLTVAAYCVMTALVFDFADGFAARLLKAQSAIGKQLDSLADMVSFGVLPFVIMFTLFKTVETTPFFAYSSFLIVVFSAIRLARFNVDTRQTNGFIGIPTPINALLIASLPLIWESNRAISFYWMNQETLLLLTLISSGLLVVEIPFFALKFKNFKLKDNIFPYIFLFFCLVSLPLMHFFAIPILYLAYILLSLIDWMLKKN